MHVIYGGYLQRVLLKVLLTRRHHEATKKGHGPTGVHSCLSVQSPWQVKERERSFNSMTIKEVERVFRVLGDESAAAELAGIYHFNRNSRWIHNHSTTVF